MVIGIIFIAVGIYYIIGIYFHWEWFKEQPKVQRLANIIGKENIFIFYLIAGIVLIVFGYLNIVLIK